LVGLDLGDQVSGRDFIALLLGPPDEDTFLHRRRQLRQTDDLGHANSDQSRYSARLTAATMSLTCGWTSSSRFFAYGIGTSSLVTRSIGASSASMQRRWIWYATSAPNPATGQPTSTITQRPVFDTLSASVSTSSGRNERGSTTSHS